MGCIATVEGIDPSEATVQGIVPSEAIVKLIPGDATAVKLAQKRKEAAEALQVAEASILVQDVSALEKSLKRWRDLVVIEDCKEVCKALGKIAADSCSLLIDAAARIEPEFRGAAIDAARHMSALLSSMKIDADAFKFFDRTVRVRRVGVAAACGPINGIYFELVDGRTNSEIQGKPGGLSPVSHIDRLPKIDQMIGNMSVMERNGMLWYDLADGEYITSLQGKEASEEVWRKNYLAATLTLSTNLGNHISFQTQPQFQLVEGISGSDFKFEAEVGHSIVDATFAEGRCKQVSYAMFRAGGEAGINEEEATVAFNVAKGPVADVLARVSMKMGAKYCKSAVLQVRMLGAIDIPVMKELLEACPHREGEDFPSHWDALVMKSVAITEGQGLQMIKSEEGACWENAFGTKELDREELDEMQKLFDATCVQKYTRDRIGTAVPKRLVVKRALQVQNLQNWREFHARKAEVVSELTQLKAEGSTVVDSVDKLKIAGHLVNLAKLPLDVEGNCAWLFHGSNEAATMAIVQGDFLINKAGSNAGTLYGPGLYLAECCSKSDEYTVANAQGEHCLMVCRVTLGNVFYTDEDRPDCDSLVRQCTSGGFHSVLGDREKINKTFREFIVYDDDLVYPEFVVWYTRTT